MKKKMTNTRGLRTIGYGVVGLLSVSIIVGMAVGISKSAVFNPEGSIAHQQKTLMIFTVMLGMLVVIPVFIMLFLFAWKYRESNKKAKYRPNESGNRLLETLWWGIPIVIILILSVVTWVSSHELDPYKTVASNNKPIRVQVVALEWRWLFIYPDYGVASLSEVRFPEKTPINFELTADAPMSAFWIPKLGSQTYAMSAMSSSLSLQADHPGVYRGSNTNINGTGYSKMTFNAVVSSSSDFQSWLKTTHKAEPLDMSIYAQLSKQSSDNSVRYFSLSDKNLYNDIMSKYMQHEQSTSSTDSMNMNNDGMTH